MPPVVRGRQVPLTQAGTHGQNLVGLGTGLEGSVTRPGMNVAKVIDPIPNNPDASADWNAGVRAGCKEELARVYPELKGR